jgi:hypothetical protein
VGDCVFWIAFNVLLYQNIWKNEFFMVSCG